MALDADRMRNAIRAQILANVPGANDDNGAVTNFASAIAAGVVDEINANGVVTVPGNTYSTGISPSVVLVPTPLNMSIA